MSARKIFYSKLILELTFTFSHIQKQWFVSYDNEIFYRFEIKSFEHDLPLRNPQNLSSFWNVYLLLSEKPIHFHELLEKVSYQTTRWKLYKYLYYALNFLKKYSEWSCLETCNKKKIFFSWLMTVLLLLRQNLRYIYEWIRK